MGLFNRSLQIVHADSNKNPSSTTLSSQPQLPKIPYVDVNTTQPHKAVTDVVTMPLSFKIDVTGIPKERLIIALFNNVYRKSEFSEKVWMNIADHIFYGGSAAPLGMDRAPDKYEVKKMLTNYSYIDYIGPVEFKMDFSGALIDTKQYDEDHKTCTTLGVLTAKECIEKLKQEIFLENLVVETLKNALGIIDSNESFEWNSYTWLVNGPSTFIQTYKKDLSIIAEIKIHDKTIHELGTIFQNGGVEKDALINSIVQQYERSVMRGFERCEKDERSASVDAIESEKAIKDGREKPWFSADTRKKHREDREAKFQIKKEKYEAWLSSSRGLQKTEQITTNTLWTMFFGSSTSEQTEMNAPKPPKIG